MVDEAFLREEDRDGERFDHAMVGDQVDQPAQGKGTQGQGHGHERALQAAVAAPVQAGVEPGDQAAHQHGRMGGAVPDQLRFAEGCVEDHGGYQDHASAIPLGGAIRKGAAILERAKAACEALARFVQPGRVRQEPNRDMRALQSGNSLVPA